MFGQRWGVRRMLIVGLSVATIGLGVVPLAEFVATAWQAVWLVVTYIVAWLGGTLYIVNSLPFVMSKTDSAERAHVLSVREALAPLSLFAGTLIGGLLPGFLAARLGATLADPVPYRYALFIAAALFGFAPLTFLATAETKAKEPPQQQLWTSSAGQPAERSAAPIGLIVFMAAVMLLQLAGNSVTDTYLNVYLDVSLHLSPAWIGTLSAIAQLLVVPIALIAPLIVIHWGKGWTIIAGTLGMALHPISIRAESNAVRPLHEADRIEAVVQAVRAESSCLTIIQRNLQPPRTLCPRPTELRAATIRHAGQFSGG